MDADATTLVEAFVGCRHWCCDEAIEQSMAKPGLVHGHECVTDPVPDAHGINREASLVIAYMVMRECGRIQSHIAHCHIFALRRVASTNMAQGTYTVPYIIYTQLYTYCTCPITYTVSVMMCTYCILCMYMDTVVQLDQGMQSRDAWQSGDI